MEGFYCGARIPEEEELDAVFDDVDHDGGSHSVNLDLSAHSSAASSTLSEWLDGESPSHAHVQCVAEAGKAARDRGKHSAVLAAASSPATVAERLERMQVDASSLLERVEAVKRRHARSDFVPGDRCTNSGCSIVGLLKFRHRIDSEADNASRALAQLRNILPESTTALPEDPEARAMVVKAHLTAECSSLPHLELVLRCLETERDVVGVCVPVAAHPTGHGGLGTPRDPPMSAADRLAAARLEVDVISANGRRWIKVRCSAAASATPRPDPGETDVDTAMTVADVECVELMREYARRARSVRFAFCQTVEVALLLPRPPPAALGAELRAANIRVADVATQDAGAARLAGQLAAHRMPFFPPLPLVPSFVCLDTTALVALCSETCYPSELSSEQRETNLTRYKVLSGQIRAEVEQPAVMGGVIEETLRKYTMWNSLRQFERGVALALLEPRAGEDPKASAQWRRTYVPVSMSLPDLSWCAGDVGKGSAGPTVESACLLDVDRQRVAWRAETDRADDQKRPNWIVTDVSYHEFRWMVETIAGRSETLRARRLLQNVMVVDTSFLRKLPMPNSALVEKGHIITFMQHLTGSAKIQERNRIVFACADALRAVILTANKRVVSSAREQGIFLWARLHPARSLTELYMHGESRHEGPRRPPPFKEDGKDSRIFSV